MDIRFLLLAIWVICSSCAITSERWNSEFKSNLRLQYNGFTFDEYHKSALNALMNDKSTVKQNHAFALFYKNDQNSQLSLNHDQIKDQAVLTGDYHSISLTAGIYIGSIDDVMGLQTSLDFVEEIVPLTDALKVHEKVDCEKFDKMTSSNIGGLNYVTLPMSLSQLNDLERVQEETLKKSSQIDSATIFSSHKTNNKDEEKNNGFQYGRIVDITSKDECEFILSMLSQDSSILWISHFSPNKIQNKFVLK